MEQTTKRTAGEPMRGQHIRNENNDERQARSTGQRTQYQQKHEHTPVPCPDQTAATNGAILAAISPTRKLLMPVLPATSLSHIVFRSSPQRDGQQKRSVMLAQIW